MKVNNSTTSPTHTGTIRGADAGKTKGKDEKFDANKATADLGSAKIEMSKDALAMQKAKAIASKDVTDDAKVARLQKMIDDGNYKVDSEAIADRLVNEHLLMGE